MSNSLSYMWLCWVHSCNKSKQGSYRSSRCGKSYNNGPQRKARMQSNLRTMEGSEVMQCHGHPMAKPVQTHTKIDTLFIHRFTWSNRYTKLVMKDLMILNVNRAEWRWSHETAYTFRRIHSIVYPFHTLVSLCPILPLLLSAHEDWTNYCNHIICMTGVYWPMNLVHIIN